MARRSDRLKERRLFPDDRADAALHLAFFQAIQRMAGADTGFAAGTAIEIDDKRILFSRFRTAERDEIAIAGRPGGGLLVEIREALDRGEIALVSQREIDQRK